MRLLNKVPSIALPCLVVLNFILGLRLIDGSIYVFLHNNFNTNLADTTFLSIGIGTIALQLLTFALILVYRKKRAIEEEESE